MAYAKQQGPASRSASVCAGISGWIETDAQGDAWQVLMLYACTDNHRSKEPGSMLDCRRKKGKREEGRV